MKVSWIKYKQDKKNFVVFKGLGFPVYELEDLEQTDQVIRELIEHNCKTIILTNEVASFSQDIIKKYDKQDEISIIITPDREDGYKS